MRIKPNEVKNIRRVWR